MVKPADKTVQAESLRIAPILLAASAAAVYVLLRPPLFNFDGYLNRLSGLAPLNLDVINPHHLLWYPLEILLARTFSVLGKPSPAAFQFFGIAVNCITLFFLQRLLGQITRNPLLATTGTVFVACAPQFWFMGFQNQPYSVLYLCIVLYLAAWPKEEDQVPTRRQLISSGVWLSCAVLSQQAVALLVPAGALTLLICSREPLRKRLTRSLIWAGSISIFISAIYLWIAKLMGLDSLQELLDWLTDYMHTQHSAQVRLPESVSKSVMGITRSLAQTSRLEDLLLDYFSGKVIYWFYAGLALMTVLVAVFAFRKREMRSRLCRSVNRNSLFAVSILSMFAGGAFVFAWEPAGHFWGLILFPALVCVAFPARHAPRNKVLLISALFVLLSGWNLHANHVWDRTQSINFPEPWIDAIHKELTDKDVFIVLGRDWFADMDYDLLLGCLDTLPRNPGIALLNEFVLNPEAQKSWPQKLQARIDSTFRNGGRVFVANHLLAAESYDDLPAQENPFSEYTREEYLGIDPEKLQQDLQAVLRNYKIVPSPLRIGFDPFWELKK